MRTLVNTILTIHIYDYLKEHGPRTFREIFSAVEKRIEPDRATRVFYNSLMKSEREKPMPELAYRIRWGKKRIIYKIITWLVSQSILKQNNEHPQVWERVFEVIGPRPKGHGGGLKPRKKPEPEIVPEPEPPPPNCIGA